MGKKSPILRVRLFGNASIAYGDDQILYGKNSITKVMKLLLLLIYCGAEGISRNRLMEEMFGRKELTDASNNLRVYLFRLKKMLLDAGLPEYEYIVCQNGMYYWDSPMDMVVDTDVFKQLLDRAEKEIDEDNRMNLLREACQIYRGDFLEKLSGDEWVIVESLQYKAQYASALQELCQMLQEREEYVAALRAVEPACEMYPFDDWQTIRMECYIAMGHYDDAMKEYENTSKFLYEELGLAPSERMTEQLNHLSELMGSRAYVMAEIKENLSEPAEERRGAFFCNYQGFHDACCVVRRGMERNGQSVFLVLCTLVDTKGNPMENSKRLEEMSQKLHMSLRMSLRRCDFFTKYSQAQYLVVLVGTSEENCQIAIGRVRNRFADEHKSWAGHLKCIVSSLMDLEA